MEKQQINFAKVFNLFISEIEKDKELYYGYQANIAMQFYDEFARNKKQ